MKCLVLIYGFIAVSTIMQEPARVWRIMAIGDSITQGGKTNTAEYTYRLPLQMIFSEKGISYDFIGSRRAGLHENASWPQVQEGVPFDPDHEGYYGKKTAFVVGQVMENWNMHNEVSDIVLIHLGTNDQGTKAIQQEIIRPLDTLIAFLREKNPEVIILLGHLNFRKGEQILAIREAVEALAKERDTAHSPVQTIHHYRDWIPDPVHLYTDTFDWAHPNLKGQEKMAENWYQAIEPLINQ